MTLLCQFNLLRCLLNVAPNSLHHLLISKTNLILYPKSKINLVAYTSPKKIKTQPAGIFFFLGRGCLTQLILHFPYTSHFHI